jgi:hypothetical protein
MAVLTRPLLLLGAGMLLAAGAMVAKGKFLQPEPPRSPLPWRLDLASSAVDPDGKRLYGLSSRWRSRGPDYYVESLTPSACPAGGDALRFALLAFEGQRYIGGRATVAPPEWGQTYVHRGRIRYHMGKRSAVHTQKLLIVADSGPGNRPIVTIGTHEGEPTPLVIGLQIDGGAYRMASRGLATDAWHSWEVEINPGQPSGGGFYTLAVNGKRIGKQDGLTFTDGERRAQGTVGIGYYLNDSVAANDDWWFELCDVSIAAR